MPVILGDCLEVMKRMDAETVDAIVTDPPAGISFMGKKWDHDKGGRDCWIAWMTTVAIECLRVIKPGGHALVWSIPRTSHWTATAWENAGWEVRDKVIHIFGSGFPKSLNISKSLDAAAGVEREVIGERKRNGGPSGMTANNGWNDGPMKNDNCIVVETAPTTDIAKLFDGYGTALKPAHEDWLLFRKPLEGTVAQNILKWGVGGINIDGCRVPVDPAVDDMSRTVVRKVRESETWEKGSGFKNETNGLTGVPENGRFPANIIHDGSKVVALFPNTKSGKPGTMRKCVNESAAYGAESRLPGTLMTGFGDEGSAARFFYCAKASRSERGVDNKHPTVKPLALMRYLCRLITPPRGIILDPFAGSGSTGVAAKQEGFQSILIELEQESYETANARMRNVK